MSDLQEKRHSLAHLLGAALCELYPDTKLAIGPAIDDGFYYDAELSTKISTEDLKTIENKMREIAGSWKSFEKHVVTEKEARKQYPNNPYKNELIDQFVQDGSEITLYSSGTFTDLCSGGHVKKIDKHLLEGFTLHSVAGAYWRGDEKNKMLTRVYGLAFNSEKELAKHVEMIEEAKKRDHRKLGKELDLFTFSKLVGPGLPLFTPKGAALRKAVEDTLSILLEKYGYEKVWIPHITKQDLYKTSGHWEKFGDELFKVQGAHEEFVLKPMNCPHHTQIYASTPKSYTDLPIRYAEFTTVYRDEQKGELLGLSRVLSITQDDGHIFCTEGQVEIEVSNTISMIKEFYTALGFFKGDDCEVFLSVRGDEKSKYLGDEKVWDHAEAVLRKALKSNKMKYTEEKGEAAFYGPKIDFHFKDSLGRTWQLSTVQLDFVMPDRFKLTYNTKDNKKQTPIMIHRAIAGSLERLLGILIEHFNGHFPFFLAPIQVRVIPIGENENSYAESVVLCLKEKGIRVDNDMSSETIGKKIAKAHVEKIPVRIVVGKQEKMDGAVTMEMDGEKVTCSIEECTEQLYRKNNVCKN